MPNIDPDPILEAIERHRVAINAWLDAERATERLAGKTADNPRSSAYADAMKTVERLAFEHLFTTPPHTLAGAIALLTYVKEADAIGDQLLEFTTIPDYRIAGLALVDSLIKSLDAIKARG